MPCQHKLDPRLAQGFHDIQVLLAREAEDALDTLVLERGDKKIGALVIAAPALTPSSRL
jgi:hypothetical protein